MLYSACLLATVGICSWIALDLIAGPLWRKRIASIAILAVAGVFWAGGELLISIAAEPSDILVGRRVLFLGVCLLGPAWFWSAIEASAPGWSSRRRWWLVALMLPELGIYSTLYWDTSGLFVDGTSSIPKHGPLFALQVVYSWGLILTGLVVLLSAMRSTAIPSTANQRLLLFAAVTAPLLANAIFVLLDVGTNDPTPILLAISALGLRHVVLDIIWGAHHLPFARDEVVEQMDTGFLVADREGRILDSNHAARTFLEPGSLQGRTLDEVMKEIEQHHGFDFEVVDFPLRRRGQTVGTGLAIHDRSEQRRLERQLETKTRLEGLTHLASSIAHEVNNPLSYLTTNLALIEPLVAHLHERTLRDCAVCGGLPDEIRELASDAFSLLSESREGAERIRLIIAQLGTLIVNATDGEEISEPHAFDLDAAVERAINFVTFSHERANLIFTPSGNAEAFASELDVLHILIQLLLNAIREVGEDGQVEVRVSDVSDGLLVEVLDEGRGISEVDLPHVFDPLYTTGRPGRLGLGLSHCWRLARQNNGHIEATNRASGGAVFALTLPVAKH